MKIAVASDDGTRIAAHFGRTRGFAIYEMEAGEPVWREFRTNSFTGHRHGQVGAGHAHDHHGPVLAALADCEAVISHGMGRRIYDDLVQAGKEVYITAETVVAEAIRRFADGSLANQPERGCQHGHGYEQA